jgi:hydrogenase nickel incorporation protein HypB
MCTTCGCGQGETKLDGKALDAHAHEHTHADGTTHSHPHDHEHQHGHGEHGHGHHHYVPAHSHAPGVPQRPLAAEGAPRSGGVAPASGMQTPDFDSRGRASAYAVASPHAGPLLRAPASRRVQIEQDILAKNDAYARENRAFLAGRRVFALNLVSSPGSGKTTLLVKTIEALKDRQAVAVIEGDQQTSQDAERIRATGAPAIQINTGKGCHLDAHMVGHAIQQLDPAERSLLMIENVGNLVCPAAFDLGEAHKVVVLSVTEGEDKPIKYPDMFRAARLMLLNKCDLLPHLDFDVDRAIAYARRVNPEIEVVKVSARSGEGMDAWLVWLEQNAAK